MTNRLYTQRDWDRTVGVGKVPYKYSLEAKIREDKRAERIEQNVGERQERSRQTTRGRPNQERDEKTTD